MDHVRVAILLKNDLPIQLTRNKISKGHHSLKDILLHTNCINLFKYEPTVNMIKFRIQFVLLSGRRVNCLNAVIYLRTIHSPDCVYSKQKVTDITYLRVKCKLTRSVAQIKHQFSKVYPGTRSGNHTKEGFIKILLPTRSTLYTVHTKMTSWCLHLLKAAKQHLCNCTEIETWPKASVNIQH